MIISKKSKKKEKVIRKARTAHQGKAMIERIIRMLASALIIW